MSECSAEKPAGKSDACAEVYSKSLRETRQKSGTLPAGGPPPPKLSPPKKGKKMLSSEMLNYVI